MDQPPRDNPLRRTLDVVRDRPLATAAAGALIVALIVTFILPVLEAVRSGFVHQGEWSLYWFGRVLSNEIILRELGNGLLLASLTTLACLLVAVPMAVLRARCEFRGQGLLGAAVLLPLILPPFVGALSIRRLLGQFGALNLLLERIGLLELGAGELPPDWLSTGFVGVVILQVLHLFPIMYLNASAALANVDPAHVQAARNLGAGPVRTFLRITLPLMSPGLFAGGTIVFIWSFTDIGTPLIVGYERLAPVHVFKDLVGGQYSGRVFSLVFILLAMSVGLYVLGKFVFGRSTRAESSKATVAAERRRLGWIGTAGAWLLFGGVVFLAIIPHIGVVLTALSDKWINTVLPSEYTLRHMKSVITSEETYRSILNSLKYAGASTLIDVLAGVLAAWLIVRARVAGRRILDATVMLPLAVPGLILAAGYVAITVPGSPLEVIGPKGAYPFVILIIAYAVRRLPFVVRGVSAGLQQVSESLEEAARNLGASRAYTVLRITVPLIAANLIAAGVLTFAFAMLEVSDSLVLAQLPQDYPITKEIYIKFTSGTGEAVNTAAALGVYGMALLGGTLALASALLGKRLGAIFRA